jgi:hypothetical protein
VTSQLKENLIKLIINFNQRKTLHTLKDLQNGLLTLQSLGPDKRLKIAEGLTQFPREIFE